MSTIDASSIDLSVFQAPTQTSEDDRIGLEAIRLFLTAECPHYNYLELGSYLGGTLLPHVVSPNCSRILSVDKRVSSQSDERRADGFSYEGITTEALLEELRRHVDNPACLEKIETHDGVISDLSPEWVRERYPETFQLCLIDAEHTNEAVFSDFLYTFRLVAPDSIILLHDSWMLASGIQNIICYLESEDIPFYFCQIRDSVTAFFLGRYATEKQRPAFVRTAAFDRDEYFRACNDRLWTWRKADIISDLSPEERLHGADARELLTRMNPQEVLNGVRTRALLKTLIKRIVRRS